MTNSSQLACLAFWQFGSMGMLGWAAAAALPVLIHLWSRRKYRPEPWAAMTFLLAALRKNARRIQLEQWLLLALRTAILLLFAMALADPQSSALSGWVGEQHGGESHIVLVLDSSYSMDYREEGNSRFEAAKGLAKQLVSGGQQGNGYTVIIMSEPPRTVIGQPAFDKEDVLQELDSLEIIHTGANLPATLAEVESVLRRSAELHPRLTRSHVYFFTDLQKGTWEEVATTDCQARLSRLEKNASLDLFDLGKDEDNNLAVARLEIDQPLVTAHTDIQIQADIQSFSRDDRPRQAVEVLVDGQRIADERIDVPALGRVTVQAKHRFDVPGEHTVEAHLTDDPLPLDNRRWLSVPVAESIRVLLVGGRPAEARHLALALAPQKQSAAGIEVVEAPESRLLEEGLAGFDCIFLANIGRFSREEAQLVNRYVRAGGGVVIFLGDQVQSENYNALLGGDGEARLLPAHLEGAAPTASYRVNPLDYTHPIVSSFRGFEHAGLLTTPVWKFIRSSPVEGAKVALALERGDPAIVEHSVGQGRSILVTTAASADSLDRTTSLPTPWTAFASWPSFPPLVHEMLRFAIAGRNSNRNLLVGEEIKGGLPALSASDRAVTVSGPNGREERLPIATESGEPRFGYDQTWLSGMYEVRAAGNVRRFAANLNPRESDLAHLDADSLPPQFRRNAVETTDEWGTAGSDSTFSHFRWLLASVFILLVLEPCLGWLLGRGRV